MVVSPAGFEPVYLPVMSGTLLPLKLETHNFDEVNLRTRTEQHLYFTFGDQVKRHKTFKLIRLYLFMNFLHVFQR